MQKLYIAAPAAELGRATHWMTQARTRGFIITYDWTVDIRRAAESGQSGGDSALPRHARKRYARQDMEGVTTAEGLWLLAPSEGFRATGAWVELGAALAMRDEVFSRATPRLSYKVVVSGAQCRKSIFTELADMLFDTDDAAFAWWQSQIRLKQARV